MMPARVRSGVASAPPFARWAVGALALSAIFNCRNVATDAGEEGDAVELGAPQNPAALPAASSSVASVPPSAAAFGPAEQAVGTEDEAMPVAEPDEPEAILFLRATGDTPAPCDAWLDALAEVTEFDLAVWYHSNPTEAEATPIQVPFLDTLQCSPVALTRDNVGSSAEASGPEVVPTDAAAPMDAGRVPDGGRTDGGTLRDAASDAGTTADGSPPQTAPVYSLVDLSLEGWYLVTDERGVHFRLCPNACFTFQQRGGEIVIEMQYAIGGFAAR
jgi:hypothetical protein